MRHNIIIATIALITIVVFAGCRLTRSLGRNPIGDDLNAFSSLSNYKDGGFQNEVARPPAPITRRKRSPLLYMFRGKRETVQPSYGLPVVKTDLKKLAPDTPAVVWFGHSSVLIRSKKATVLIDPIFSDNAGPIPIFVRAYQGTKRYRAAHMPDIDAVVISHDHYDHMDYRTLMKLNSKTKKFVVPLGVGSHLRFWGIDPKKIVELNWHSKTSLPGELNITATPAQHRSNRTFGQQNKTLWASYVIQMDKYKLFYSGDGGYGPHFKQIGKRYGPFDLALLECGQYSPNWPYTHMMPEETAQAAADLKAHLLQPVHWAKFAESDHVWNEPVHRLIPAAEKLGVPVSIPHLGESYTLGTKPKDAIWWEFDEQ